MPRCSPPMVTVVAAVLRILHHRECVRRLRAILRCHPYGRRAGGRVPCGRRVLHGAPPYLGARMCTRGCLPSHRATGAAMVPSVTPQPATADSPPRTPPGFLTFYPLHRWTHVVLAEDAGPSSTPPTLAMALPSPTLSSPEYVTTGIFGHASMPAPPGFRLTGTIAARRRAPPLRIETADGEIYDVALAPPPPLPCATTFACHHASDADNRRPDLIRT
uniref:Uncharacterized protein n=1 Tax=Arundo donax TaxID=35708 RepID=A0A0A9A336_ARUDO